MRLSRHLACFSASKVHPGGRRYRFGDRSARHFSGGPSRTQLADHASPALAEKGRFGLRDYEKLFCPDLKSGNDVFDMRGIDGAGRLVVVRPDQYVPHVLPLDAFADLSTFFARFMLPKA